MTRRSLAASALAAAAAPKIRVAMVGTGHGHAACKVRALHSMAESEFLGVCRPGNDDPQTGDVFNSVPNLELAQVLDDASIELVAMELTDPKRCLFYG